MGYTEKDRANERIFMGPLDAALIRTILGEVNVGGLIFDFDNPQDGIITDITNMALRPWPTKFLKEHNPADSAKYHPDEVGYTGGTIRGLYNIRLAETYLILAEAQHYQGKNVEAAENINRVRERSGASAITVGDVTIT